MNVFQETKLSRKPLSGYRPDIDGLRAVAVLLVLASHMRTRLFGGFIGVDVFFVISGYLISAHILTEMRQGDFSLATFYERRVRRIFPAMLVMLGVVSLLAYLYFVPFELEAYGRSLLAALFSGSNFLFWHEAGYFDAPSALKPLLHTWSLGVEEQFYVFFPLLLMTLRRYFPSRLKSTILWVTVISFAAASITVYASREAAFFFAPLRAWELLAGTILSQQYLPGLRSSWSRNIASALGLGLILIASLLYNSVSPFPGLLAIPPVLGAALIIAAGETGTSLVGRMLSLRPVVFVGLISYSLYLWHWPLIVFQETGSLFFPGMILTGREKLLMFVLSIAVATLSWSLIEQPFRKGQWKPRRKALFAINGVALGVLSLCAIAMVASGGLPLRFSPEARRMAEFGRADQHGPYREGACFLGPGYGFGDYKQAMCLPRGGNEINGRPSILILGDSHGAQLWPGMQAVYGQDHTLMQANVFSCQPTLTQFGAMTRPCSEMNQFIFNKYLPSHKVDTVLLSARWTGESFEPLGNTIEYLRGLGLVPVVLGPSLEYDTPQPRVIALAMRAGKPEKIQEHESREPKELDRKMAELARTVWKVSYISVFDDLCRPTCPIYAGDQPMLMDANHLTAGGSELLLRVMRERGQIR